MTWAVGSLVHARGREWVVLPESDPERELLVLRPLGGTDDEIAGIHLGLEHVLEASFPPPDPAAELGDHRSCALLRDALRLGFRSGAGPFRSFARIAVQPRPYQLVPLLMALKQNPVRLLIADDVGIGKTVEALLVARELLDRGEIHRLTVLCPPHLAPQWGRDLSAQFHIDAAVVLPGTAARLERECGMGESLFEHHPFTVVSTDYIKARRRRDEFLRACPELVIVDEAHTCSDAGPARSAHQQRHQLLVDLASKADRHLLLVTATPHSGNVHAFRSLLSLLDREFADLPEDIAGKANERHRVRLAEHLVQRRRADLEKYLDEDTPFPSRETAEETYQLHPAYRALFTEILGWARRRVTEKGLDDRRRRVRWWSALALLRSLGSSPAAASATLRNRAASMGATTPQEADELGRRFVLDLDEEANEGMDVVPGTVTEEDDEDADAAPSRSERRKLLEFARKVDALAGAKDRKLVRATELVGHLVEDGHYPIVFCRFIPTVHHVAAALRRALTGRAEVAAVTGELTPNERERRVEDLSRHAGRVLVCTDCLAEGINLQASFDAVVHYDLSWNPTRHEQREGRVDRFRQPRAVVKALTYYGQDNPIDGIVLEVLLRKHRRIRSSLGISVPVPVDTNALLEAVLEGLILKEETGRLDDRRLQTTFDFLEQMPAQKKLDIEWEAAAAREKASRSRFAQHAIDPREVATELRDCRRALGGAGTVQEFTLGALRALGATVTGDAPYHAQLSETPAALRDALGDQTTLRFDFEEPAPDGATLLTRSHPVVEATARHVLETALDPLAAGVGRRCGVIRSRQVTARTTLVLTRLRFTVLRVENGEPRPQLAEDWALLGFEGLPAAPTWLSGDDAEGLLTIEPDVNIAPDLARNLVRGVIDELDPVRRHLEDVARRKAKELLQAHERVRSASKRTGVRYRVEPHLPPDILGLFIYLPVLG